MSIASPRAASTEAGAISSPHPRPPLPPAPYLVIGLGRAGLAAARALAERVGPQRVRAWDAVAEGGQRAVARDLREQGIVVELGGDGLSLLEGAGTIVKSPGVPPEIPVVAAARARGLALVDELEIGWCLVPALTVGVTGTKGKSTVSKLCLAVLAAHGREPVLAGNTEFGPPLSELSLAPSPRTVVAEVSSFQAEFARALTLDAAVFTNLSRDHLRHGSMEAYGDAKRRLFLDEDRVVPLAVLSCDDTFGRRIEAEVEARGGRVLRYGRDPVADYRILAAEWGLREAELIVETPQGRTELSTRLPGAHNAANAAAALALADGLGLSRGETLAALATAEGVPGRFEAIEVGRPFDVVVDRGYTVGSVPEALATARAIVARRGGRVLTVLAVVGRAGPAIGAEVAAVARRDSDHLILSGTSYYGEPRLVTLQRMMRGARAARGGSLETVIDRRAAIARALSLARPGDLVAILGRGPADRDATDARGGSVPLDDREVVRELA